MTPFEKWLQKQDVDFIKNVRDNEGHKTEDVTIDDIRMLDKTFNKTEENYNE